MRPRLPRKSKIASVALWCSPSPNTTTSHPQREAVSEGPSSRVKWAPGAGSGNSVEPSPVQRSSSKSCIPPDSGPAKQQDAAQEPRLYQHSTLQIGALIQVNKHSRGPLIKPCLQRKRAASQRPQVTGCAPP